MYDEFDQRNVEQKDSHSGKAHSFTPPTRPSTIVFFETVNTIFPAWHKR